MRSVVEDLVIQSHRGPYTVRFGSPLEGLARGLGPQEHLIIDRRVAELYAKPLDAALRSPSVLKIEATEENKSLERFPEYVRRLIDSGVRKDHCLVAVGGGIIQDIVAFIAATLHRGIRWRYYPTTLLAQADSCIGSKSSVNVAGYKNQLGTFTPPDEIFISPDLLTTLSELERRSGIGEMIKVHIIAGWEDTRRFARELPGLVQDKEVMLRTIRRCLEIKKEKIEADEFDRGERLVMNYGHSFGHAIESATDFKVPHGIAVTLGMDLANFFSLQWGFITEEVFSELHDFLEVHYAGFEGVVIPTERFFTALARDKKNLGSQVSLILMRAPGQVFRGQYKNDAHLREICLDFFDRLKTGKWRQGAACQQR